MGRSSTTIDKAPPQLAVRRWRTAHEHLAAEDEALPIDQVEPREVWVYDTSSTPFTRSDSHSI
jgi:hypothetical protein